MNFLLAASSLTSIVGTFAGMGASYESAKLQQYNNDVNILNTKLGYTQAKEQSEENRDAALSNVATMGFSMEQYKTQQEKYKTDLLKQQSSLSGTQKTIQGATGIGGAGTSRKLHQDLVNKVKEYTDIIDSRLVVTGTFDENGTRIVKSQMDQMLLDQDTAKKQAAVYAQDVIDYTNALKDLDNIDKGEESDNIFSDIGDAMYDSITTAGDVIHDAATDIGDKIYHFFT